MPALAASPQPTLLLRGQSPGLVLAILLVLALLGVCALLLGRARSAFERARELEGRLAAERSARSELETALAGSHEVLCRLVRQQEGVRDTERARIARELHEDLGQRLLTLRAELALQQAAVRGTSPAAHDRLKAAVGGLDCAIRTLRMTVAGLRPVALGMGLRHAAEGHLAEFARLHGLDYRFEGGAGDGTGTDPGREALLLRILQEALAQVARQGAASMVSVSLLETAGETVLRIEDDGDCLPASPAGPQGSAFHELRKRTADHGGSFCLGPGRRGGKILHVRLPHMQCPAPVP